MTDSRVITTTPSTSTVITQPPKITLEHLTNTATTTHQYFTRSKHFTKHSQIEHAT